MGKTMMGLDGVGEASGHDLVPMAPDRCSTRAASSPVPIPYPIAGTSARRDPGAEKTRVSKQRVLNATGEVKRAPAVTVHFEGEPIALKGNSGREDSP